VHRLLVMLAKFSLPAALALPAVLVFTPGVAHGQSAGDDAATAKTHYAMGVRHFDLSEFDEALVEFKEAYRAKPDPAFLYDIGQCHRRLGHTDDAITSYQSYLRRAPDAKNKEEVERRIAELVSLRDADAASNANSAGGKEQPSPTSVAAQEKAASRAAKGPSNTASLDFGVRDEPLRQSSGVFYKRWWFWTAVGVVAVGTATVAIIMAERDPTKVPSTTLGSQRALP
jgi:tetratricopeptide (TPR) repeat protein